VIRVIYGLFDFEAPQLIAVVESEAIRRATNIDALHTARTWFELKGRLSPTDFKGLCDDLRESEYEAFLSPEGFDIEVPPEDALFDRSYVESEHCFDTWFIDPLADMVRWVPQEIQDYFGELGPGGMGTDRQLVLDSGRETWIVKAFADNGYEAVRNDELVQATFEWHEG